MFNFLKSKKSDKTEKTITVSGISGLKKKIYINKFIIKLGGPNNIENIVVDTNRINITIKSRDKVVIQYFRNNSALSGLFYKGNQIGFVVGDAAQKLADDIKTKCGIV